MKKSENKWKKVKKSEKKWKQVERTYGDQDIVHIIFVRRSTYDQNQIQNTDGLCDHELSTGAWKSTVLVFDPIRRCIHQ